MFPKIVFAQVNRLYNYYFMESVQIRIALNGAEHEHVCNLATSMGGISKRAAVKKAVLDTPIPHEKPKPTSWLSGKVGRRNSAPKEKCQSRRRVGKAQKPA